MSARADADFVEVYGLGNREPEVLDLITDTETRFLLACTRDRGAAVKLANHKAGREVLLPVWSNTKEAFVRVSGHPRWNAAAADYAVAVTYAPDEPIAHHRLILTLVAAGDYAAARRARAAMIGRFGATANTANALTVAWTAALVPGAPDHADSPVLLAKKPLDTNKDGRGCRVNPFDTLGAELYRAGRYAEAIEKLEHGERRSEKIAATSPQSASGRASPVDTLGWPFLAMAHLHLGHNEEARRWLNRFRDYKPDANVAANRTHNLEVFWEDLENRLLRSEAEAVILYDPIFPSDPFAH